jgi:phosphonopyruvate decarboxylase
MIASQDFIAAARSSGFDFYTGVPCSLLTSLINEVIADKNTNYIGATSEGEACGIAAGAWLAGRTPVVMLQNSGLGNTINPLTSLNHPFRIPALMLVTWRGEPGIHDEPQHVVMGQVLHRLLDTVGVAHAPMPSNLDELPTALEAARDHMDLSGLPFAFVVRKDQFGGDTAAPPSSGADSFVQAVEIDRPLRAMPTRFEAIASIVKSLPVDAAIIATTGKTGRELFTLEDREQHLYLVGSMGCASAVGLGVALNSGRPIVVLDGDGAALMKLGNFATVGAYKPAKLIHIVLDNGVHDSTGGQATVSSGVDLGGVAASSGYRSAVTTASVARLPEILEHAVATAGPHFVRIRIAPGSIEKLGRPTVTPPAVARRFRRFLTGEEVPLPESEAPIAAE